MANEAAPSLILAPPAPGEIHLWQGSFADLVKFAAWDILSTEENRRIQNMRHAVAVQRFRLTRIGLRILLSRYLGIPPAMIEISLQGRGKPFLLASPLQFNMSHAKDRIWIALAWNRAVGVDLEQERPVDVLVLARRFFHASEAGYLGTLDEASRRTAFFRFWAIKEAYLKATGEGLAGLERAVLCPAPGSCPAPSSCPVPSSDWETPALVRCPDWAVTTVPAPPGWAGAVAISGSLLRILTLDMSYGLDPIKNNANDPMVASTTARRLVAETLCSTTNRRLGSH